MARTRAAPRRRPPNTNFNLRRVAAANERTNPRERRRNKAIRFKIKFMLSQVKDVEVKQRGNVVTNVFVKRHFVLINCE